ncbi:MAG TPA: hypothetical protein EYH07_16450 [Kiloniellaceae bacterium]|nr:hypothetical protein [Kiloniellaceae bacterium]
MFRFIPGILLIQAITFAFALFRPEALQGWGWAGYAAVLGSLGILTALWFGAIAAHLRKDEIARLKDQFAQEREKLKVSAERAKTRVVKQAQKEIHRQTRRTSAQANFKVGAAIAAAVGAGGLMILSQFITLGVITLATSGGALAGYLFRVRQERGKAALPTPVDAQLIGNDDKGVKRLRGES